MFGSGSTGQFKGDKAKLEAWGFAGSRRVDGVIGIAGVVGLLLAASALIWALRRGAVSWRWVLVAVGLVVLNDVLLTNAYGLLPTVIPGERNWQGKILALMGSLAVASLPAFGWTRSGLTLKPAPGSLKPALAVSLLYVGFFAVLALMFPNAPASAEEIGFQLTMPGFEEEAFYRGVLLAALSLTFTARVRFLDVEWGWGALISCALFGLAHAFGYSKGEFSFDPIYFALTAFPSLIAVWLVLKTRSILFPVVLHNFGNAVMLVM